MGRLWSHTGALLASVTFAGETASGWQQANFSTPVAITANTVYVASYGLTIGHFSANWNYFATSGFNNAPLHALQTPDGVYGTLGTYPANTHQAANYWVDVVFKATSSTAPSISSQPASKTVAVGQTASFSVAAKGTAPLSYQWQKNGAAIGGATSSSYTTPATTSTDNGALFAVVVSNSVGKVTSSSATLTVNSAPSITTQPVSKTVTAGQTAAFAVTATGSAPLSYQWSKNGTPISGATFASYTTAAETTADNGAQFTVAVSNTAGSVTSSAAILTVNASTLVLNVSPTSLSFGSIDTGANSTLAATLTNSGNSNVTISGVGTSGAGFSANNVSSGTVLAPGQSAVLNVTFAPTSTGSVTGGVTVASNATNSPATISMTGTGVQSNFSTWVAPSLIRVGQSDTPGTLSSIDVSGARGETVDTQVVVQGPAGGLSNVNVTATALTGPGGVTIPAANVTLYREYYLSVTGTASYGGGSNPPLGSGTYAEPLIPFNDPETGAALCGSSASLKACNASVSAGQNQPYWIDISIPHGVANSPAGAYTGSVYDLFFARNSDDPAFADSVELRTADAAFGTFSLDTLAASIGKYHHHFGARLDAQQSDELVRRGEQLPFRRDRHGAESLRTGQLLLHWHPVQRGLQQHSFDQPNQYRGGKFPCRPWPGFLHGRRIEWLHRRLLRHQNPRRKRSCGESQREDDDDPQRDGPESVRFCRSLGAARFLATVARSCRLPLAATSGAIRVATRDTETLRNGWWTILQSMNASRRDS